MGSYKIVITHCRPESAISTLYLVSTLPDLAVLLRALDSSPAVRAIAVYSTLTVLALQALGRLTADDIGVANLQKLS